ncbi:MAG: phosphate ABC transporter permease subunit PstC [Burkholderiaceae bacterium]|nr:phosphate ABC transporter permease subunit PstC [Burkholderiaceae bacterium]
MMSQQKLSLASSNKILDLLFEWTTRLFALGVLGFLLAILISLLGGAWPSMQQIGLKFLWTEDWDPIKESFGAVVPIYGTLVTSAIALMIAIPISFFIAMFLTELSPTWLRRPIATAIELLAAIPSIIYGMWGLFVFAPLFMEFVQPGIIKVASPIPLLNQIFAGPPIGIGLLTAGIILAIMVIPFIAAVMRDVFELVPPMMKESAYGLGASTFEVMWKVVLPYTKVGVIGGIMLGLGRALGETMAVTFVIGNAHRLASSLLAPGNSIASALANEFTEAVGELYLSALIQLGLILFLLTTIVLALSRLLLLHLNKNEGRKS